MNPNKSVTEAASDDATVQGDALDDLATVYNPQPVVNKVTELEEDDDLSWMR